MRLKELSFSLSQPNKDNLTRFLLLRRPPALLLDSRQASCLGCVGVERRRARILSSAAPLVLDSLDVKPPPIPAPLTIPIVTRQPLEPTPVSGRLSRDVGTSQLRRIGEVVVAWAKLENSLNDLIWTVEGKTLETGRSATEDLHISSLLTALQNAMQRHLVGDKFKPERKAILNIITFVNEVKDERNMVIHGTWATFNGIPIVGYLRANTQEKSKVTFESYPADRMRDIRDFAISGIRNVTALIDRIEAFRAIHSLRH